MPLNVFMPFHQGDANLTAPLLRWMLELGGCKNYKCFLITDPRALDGSGDWPDEAVITEIQKLARRNFKYVTTLFTPYKRRMATGEAQWPLNANWCFFCACFYSAMTQTDPFLWLESDSVPLKEGWLQTLEEEYYRAGKKLMGTVMDTNLPTAHDKYLNGVAIYNARCLSFFDGAMIDCLNGAGHAFDLAAAARTVPEAHATNLFQHFWGTEYTSSPEFRAVKNEGDPYNIFTLANIQPEAVLFHRTKDSGLISLLRAKRNESTLKAA